MHQIKGKSFRGGLIQEGKEEERRGKQDGGREF
jgi:hypothetical protein